MNIIISIAFSLSITGFIGVCCLVYNFEFWYKKELSSLKYRIDYLEKANKALIAKLST